MEFQSCQNILISLGDECLIRVNFFESSIKIFKTGTCLKILHSICEGQSCLVTEEDCRAITIIHFCSGLLPKLLCNHRQYTVSSVHTYIKYIAFFPIPRELHSKAYLVTIGVVVCFPYNHLELSQSLRWRPASCNAAPNCSASVIMISE